MNVSPKYKNSQNKDLEPVAPTGFAIVTHTRGSLAQVGNQCNQFQITER